MDNGLEITKLAEVEDQMPDPKDVVFYAVTLSAQDKETFFVTGNSKHFPKKPFVVMPAELVEIMQNENEFLQ